MVIGRVGEVLRAVASQCAGLPFGEPPKEVSPQICAPLWDGQPPPANILVVRPENNFGGSGDVLCMARYVPLLGRAGYRVGIICSTGQGRLLQYSFKDEPYMSFAGPSYRLPMPLLPAVFNGKTTPHVGRSPSRRALLCKPLHRLKPYVPPKPYLHADPGRVTHYRKRVPAGAVGLCWSSGRLWQPMHPIKSMRLADMEPIWSRLPCVSLQVGEDRQELVGTRVIDVLPEAPDWAETAALIGALRCVVTVDTGVAHLAGGLGADVHLALHMEPAPYWKVGGVDSPWYPSVRVYQGCRWASVVARIAAALGCSQASEGALV
jgi:hypothetical protein